jgi:hypothetical protein
MGHGEERRDAIVWLAEGVWRWTARLTLIVGVALLVLLYGESRGLRSFLLLLVALWCVARVLPDVRPARGILRVCAYGVAWTLATVGWIGLVGPAGALLVAVVIATSPFVRFILAQKMLPWAAGTSPSTAADTFGRAIAGGLPVPPLPHAQRRASESTAPSPEWWHELPRGPALRDLDDEELCLAWRRSFVRLYASDSVALRLAVVEARGDYLNELARRHPAQFDEWLNSGARAASDPSAYIRRSPRQRHGGGRVSPDRD